MSIMKIKNDYKAIISFLESKNYPTALISTKKQIIWSSGEYWNEILLKIHLPNEPYSEIEVLLQDGRTPISITGYKENDVTTAYVLEIFEMEHILKLVNKSRLSDKMRDCGVFTRTMTSSIMSLVDNIDMKLSLVSSSKKSAGKPKIYSREIQEIVKTIHSHSSELLLHTDNFCLLFDNNSAGYGGTQTDLNEVFNMIFSICDKELKKVKRQLIFSTDDTTQYADIHTGRLTAVIMNLIQNALLYSPPKSQITMNINYDNNYAKIVIGNIIRGDFLYLDFDSAGIGVMAVKTVIENIGGKFLFTQKDNTAKAEIILPLTKEIKPASFSSSFVEMTSDKNAAVRLSLNKVIKIESALIKNETKEKKQRGLE